MAELSLKQIEDRLNLGFTGENRKLIFWYDDQGEFLGDIENLQLKNAKIHQLRPNNLFQTKILLERDDKESNYLIYAPFAKGDARANHLADTLKYSQEFFADRASLLALDLGIDEKYKAVLQKYLKFFKAKDRSKRFYKLQVDVYTEDLIEIAILSALTKAKIANFEEVLRLVLTSGDLKDNDYLAEFENYGLLDAFWKQVSHHFAFVDEAPNLEKLVISLFLTYAQKEIDLPPSMDKYILSKSGSVVAFMDQLMNSMLYRQAFDHLSEKVYATIGGQKLFEHYQADDLLFLDIFRFVDKKIIKWIIDRLLDENLNASMDGMDIPKLCRFREDKHFGQLYYNDYHVLRHAFHILRRVNYQPAPDLKAMIEKYDQDDFMIDTHYRKFYYYLDLVANHHFDDLQVLVENVYTHKFLDVISKEFNHHFSYEKLKGVYKVQRDFYKNFIDPNREMTVVIISDALRYEVAKELVKTLKRDKKVETVEIEPQVGVIPSYTRLGMAALLPHGELTIDDAFEVLVDGRACTNLVQRQAILKSHISQSASIQYDDLKKYKMDQLRNFFKGKAVVYVYHNQIDARGDKLNTEDEVFMACKESIDEIEELIIRLTNNVSRTRFIVTADHGFIYKREKMVEADKIDSFFSKDDQINKRFIVSNQDYEVMGTKSFPLADTLGNDDRRTITVPLTSNIFKASGAGQNFVHGGSSPQEILIPVVQVKTIRGYRESENVKIALITMLTKNTALNINLDFIQQEAISDVVKPTTYKISFMDEAGAIISNEEVHLANSKETESAKRIFKLAFNLKDQKYYRSKKYYLVATDSQTGIEAFRHEIMMDIAFAGGFGFDL